jgi:serpin B
MRNVGLAPAVAAILAVVVSACGPSSGGPRGSQAPNRTATDLFASVQQRVTTPAADGTAVNAVVAGTNELAVASFREAVGAPTRNAVYAPYSVSTALLLAMAGTGGESTAAFAELLGVEDVAGDKLHAAVNALDLVLESRSGDGIALRTANKLWVQDGVELRDAFLDTAVGSYGAPVAAVDFAARGDVAAAVNRWVSEQTDGFIERLTDGYPATTRLVLANAMFLQARWAVKFHSHEAAGTFVTADGRTVTIDVMAHHEYLPSVEGGSFVAVELPYAGGNLGLLLIEPADLGAFEAALTAESLGQIATSLEENGIHLTMPMWSTSTSLELLEPLHALGMPSTYDFSSMFAEGGAGSFIDSISHVARIDVDESGTTAAGTTDLAIAVSHGPIVRIDRPFFYAIRDRGSGAILFLGHVVDPTAS